MDEFGTGLTAQMRFADADWTVIPNSPGVYVIWDLDEIIYVGMAGRNGKGSLQRRLRDHASGQIVNMFAQYLFLARVQFVNEERITHPRDAKAACHQYIHERCSFQYRVAIDGRAAKSLEDNLKAELTPAFNS